MSDDHDDTPDNSGTPRRSPRSPSKYTDKPYEVGKGKPPKATQFKPGNKGGGRKKGSRNKTDFDKQMNEWIEVGEDRLGRPKRKRIRYVIDRQLLQQALKGDLAAIRLVKEFELKMAALRRGSEPDPSPKEIARREREEGEKRALAERLSRDIASHLELVAALRRMGLVEFRGGRPVMPAWAMEAAKAHQVTPSSQAGTKD